MKLVQFADPMDRARYVTYLRNQLQATSVAVSKLEVADMADDRAIKAALYQIAGRAQSMYVTASNRVNGVESDPAPVDDASIITE
jgi:hypothetical protein